MAGAIVGRYQGMVYRARESPLPVEVEFRADGSLRSTFSFAPDAEGPFEGTFAVPSPTQLIVAPGRGVTTFDIDLRADTLSFRHRELDAHFVLRREGAAAPRDIGIDPRTFAGPYRGTAYYTEEPENELGAVERVEVVFGRSGAIGTNFGNDGGLSAAGIADVQIEGDRLHFTSFEDNAYFVFERE